VIVQVLPVAVIPHRRFGIGVASQALGLPDRRPPNQGQGDRGVPQGVGGDLLLDPGLPRPSLYDLSDGVRGDGSLDDTLEVHTATQELRFAILGS